MEDAVFAEVRLCAPLLVGKTFTTRLHTRAGGADEGELPGCDGAQDLVLIGSAPSAADCVTSRLTRSTDQVHCGAKGQVRRK